MSTGVRFETVQYRDVFLGGRIVTTTRPAETFADIMAEKHARPTIIRTETPVRSRRATRYRNSF